MNTVLNVLEAVAIVSRAGVNVNVSRVSTYMGQSQPKTKKQLDHLAERGILARIEYMYRANCKSTMYKVTSKGRLLIEALNECRQKEMPF